MRLSCNEFDPGYDSRTALFATIMFNGQPIDYVITADEELGYVLRYKVANGEVCHHNGELLTEELRGVVKIVLGDERPGKVALLPKEVTYGTPVEDSEPQLVDTSMPRAPVAVDVSKRVPLWRCSGCMSVLLNKEAACPNGCTAKES